MKKNFKKYWLMVWELAFSDYRYGPMEFLFKCDKFINIVHNKIQQFCKKHIFSERMHSNGFNSCRFVFAYIGAAYVNRVLRSNERIYFRLRIFTNSYTDTHALFNNRRFHASFSDRSIFP